MTYSRQNPSARYRDLIGMYQTMHQQGDARLNIPPEHMFPGQSLPRHAGTIKQLIDKFQVKTLLDYGCGKGQQYEPMNVNVPGVGTFPSIPAFWGVSVHRYDPAYLPFTTLPTGKFDAAVCTDVLEHCPEEDIPWIIGEIFSYATRFVYANVACYPAKKSLPNGENAHATIRPMEWWKQFFEASAAANGNVAYLVLVEEQVQTPQGPTIKTSAFASPGLLPGA